jgi:hypothetical protein
MAALGMGRQPQQGDEIVGFGRQCGALRWADTLSAVRRIILFIAIKTLLIVPAEAFSR